MSGQVLAGEFERNDPAYLTPGVAALVDGDGFGVTNYTTGTTRLDQLPFSPNLTERWTIIGYSVRIRMGLLQNGAGPMWGRIGNLWAGLISDSPLASAQSPNFPIDLSTFVQVFNGGQDTLRLVADPSTFATPALINDAQYSLIAQTFMLPQPIQVRSGSQLQMALIMTPSMLTSLAGLTRILVRSCSYSVLYND